MLKKIIKDCFNALGIEIIRLTEEVKKQKDKEIFYMQLFEKYKDYTMVSFDSFIINLSLIEPLKIGQGAIVECGVWRGGMIAAMAEIGGNQREYHLFDSFEGLPPAKEIDGERAIAWQQNTESPGYYDNCRAEQAFAEKAMKMANCSHYHLHKGWFDNKMSEVSFKNGIDILRLDADWYDSTMICLESLFPKVNTNGMILIDDYYTWDGCSKAVHDYLSKYQLPYRIHQKDNKLAYIIKNA